MNIIYWCPYLTKIATIKSVINSCKSFQNTKYTPKIINSCGEWQFYDKKQNLINFYDNFNLHKYLPKYGFFKSRLSLLIISIITFFPLILYLKKNKPKFLIIHLLTSVPLILNMLFNFDTKIILRISGMPKLGIFRNFLWKLGCKNIYAITVPTEETLKKLKEKKIFSEHKIFLLRDPIIELKKNITDLNSNNEKFLKKKFLLSVGRLTKQKNHKFLIDCFCEIRKFNKNLELIILGEGEQKNRLIKLIDKYNLQGKVHFLGYQDPVPFYKNARCFVSTSLWEDPGFTMIEAAYYNCFIISSDCESGPKEFLEESQGGLLFKNNNKKDFLEKFNEFNKLDIKTVFKKKIFAKKKTKLFTKFNHKKSLINILEN